jgi:cytoskeleton protein RodZ
MATTIGEQLRLARDERGIALREISNQTRISMRYLEAIETDDYKRLPGGIFNRSFVKAYARCVGFDEKQAAEGYARLMREQGQSIDDVDLSPHHSKVYTDAPATRSPVLTVFLAILILAILTLGALAAVHWYQRRSAASEGRRSPLEQSRLALVKSNRANLDLVSSNHEHLF